MTQSGSDSIASGPDNEIDLNDLFQAVTLQPQSAPNSSDPRAAALFPGENGGGMDDTISTNPNNEDTSNLCSLLCLETSADIDAVCGGLTGTGNTRFCTKPRHPRPNCCTTTKHQSLKADLKPNSFYIVKNSTSAFVSPTGNMLIMSPSQIKEFRLAQKPLSDWQKIFAVLNNHHPATSTEFVQEETDRKLQLLSTGLPLKTPMRTRSQIKFEDDATAEYHDTVSEDKFDLPDDSESAWCALPKSFKEFFTKLVFSIQDISQFQFGLGRDVKALENVNKLVGQDLETLDLNLRTMEDRLGKTIKFNGNEVPNVQRALDGLVDRITTVDNQLQSVNTTLSEGLFQESQRNEASRNRQLGNWAKITPLLRQVKDVIRSHLQFPNTSLHSRIQILEETVLTLRRDNSNLLQTARKSNLSSIPKQPAFDSLFFDDTSDSPSQAESTPTIHNAPISDELLSRIKTLEEEVSVIHNRTLNDGVRPGEFHFLSMDELCSWVNEHVPQYKFGLFLDGVSIWEYLNTHHQNMQEVMVAFRHTSLVGFATLHEGKVATSFQNVLPAILGRGSDMSAHLPGIPSYSKWDAGNGTAGLSFLITHELTKVHTQIIQNIRNSVSQHTSPVRALAGECLQRSIQFVHELSAYTTRFHSELIASGSFSKDQCWALVSRCVKRCFQDMADVRVTARDVKHKDDHAATTAEYIWATLRTHQIMDDYLKHNFEDHPAFASVITRFVTNNSFKSDLRNMETRIEKTEKEFKTLKSQVDKLLSKVDRLDKQLNP